MQRPTLVLCLSVLTLFACDKPSAKSDAKAMLKEKKKIKKEKN